MKPTRIIFSSLLVALFASCTAFAQEAPRKNRNEIHEAPFGNIGTERPSTGIP